jgi:[ribosomal protein S5]-alanine N-acetyltransferase
MKTVKKTANKQIRLPLKGKRIQLREMHLSDAPAIQRLLRNRTVSRYTYIPYPYRIDDAKKFIRQAHSWSIKKHGYRFGIEDISTGEIIGGIALFDINEKHRKSEFGYWLGKPYWGKGIMAEAVELMLSFAFGQLKLKRVYGHVFSPNKRSANVVEKFGFTLEGTLRSSVRRQNQYWDERVYSILREEYYARMKKKNRK